ncbi:pentapeptide repeat-containing protein [Anabaena subtropica]|uniref:Pentapeptide repeat-containing protein n=1 Tax=Anabaena subtropica FACHB-260 TaxID=2692884 RepID=A0ABR8CXX4_9NOST|nr:pentapeptide repeat-containing protein [Anabaena subtropica]MBD2346620.1 pentapeptide repeat-containing protein [Anabaena subtropica FACHB-260]
MLNIIFNVYRTVAGQIQHNHAFVGDIINEMVFPCKEIQSFSPRVGRGKIAQRLKIAIEYLHHETIESRLKAVYELEQIAQDYPQHHWLIMEALSNFVRLNAFNISPAQLNTGSTSPLHAEIQAALTVIAQRDRKQDPENKQLDLSHVDIRGANLRKANLEQANLYRVNLSGANLAEANLCGTILSAADLSGANLAGANLSGSILSAANLTGVNLTGANLSRASLYLANLQEAILNETIFNEANLRDVKFTTTEISNGNSVSIRHPKSKS